MSDQIIETNNFIKCRKIDKCDINLDKQHENIVPIGDCNIQSNVGVLDSNTLTITNNVANELKSRVKQKHNDE